MCNAGVMECAWQWLSGLQGAQGAFVGSITGSLFGIIALVIGALFNFWLTRRRDARIRSEEAHRSGGGVVRRDCAF